jgi:acetylornithine deacetylase/succinyl-diaminopimelate desuccinylase-like protein
MSRRGAISRIGEYFDDGVYFDDVARRVAIATESQEPARRTEQHRDLGAEMTPSLQLLGFECATFVNPLGDAEPPVLVARRHERDDLPTVFAHGDVVRGYDDRSSYGRSPRRLERVGDRWYRRGTADNKGQHSINPAALAAVLADAASSVTA